MVSTLIGQSLGRYHILEQLGEGGMATVYKAYDMRLEREEAVKVIRTERLTIENTPKAIKRFEREAKSLAKLTHPNIVPVSDYGEFEGKPFLVMPYLPGGTLKQKLGKPIPWREAIQLLLPIAEALDYAHSQNMVHRDVKPSNILLTQRDQPMLTDFGIAKVLDLDETVDLTGTSAVLGTPEYMAPEQATAKTVDHRADIYSLGIVLYEMVTGRKPYTADTPMAVLIKQAIEPLPLPKIYIPGLPDEVEKVLLKALAKRPDDRFQNMAAFSKALERLLKGKSNYASETRRPARGQIDAIRNDLETRTQSLTGVMLPQTIPVLGRYGINRHGRLFLLIGSMVIVVAFLLFVLRTIAPILLSTFTISPVLTATPVLSSASLFTSAPTALSTEITNAEIVQMVLVPAGNFMMGASNDDNQARNDEKPQHIVYLNSYSIDKSEVTVAKYNNCVSAGHCMISDIPSAETPKGYYANSSYVNYPAIDITWNQANGYCRWSGKRLPTEAEWEKAARGTDARLFPWGNQSTTGEFANLCDSQCLLDYANLGIKDGYAYIAPVGSFPAGASPYGIYDMAGNVWEWVADWYSPSYFKNAPSNNPPGPSNGTDRVVRGGGWDSQERSLRVSNRLAQDPLNFYSASLGFRCASSSAP